MKNQKAIDPRDFESLARKDLYRLEKRITEKIPRIKFVAFKGVDWVIPHGLDKISAHPLSAWQVVQVGRGPKIDVKRGYGLFRTSYIIAEDSLLNIISSGVKGIKNPGLILETHYQGDGDCNRWGDYMWHKFIILKPLNIFAFWFRKFKNLFKKP